MKAAQLTWDRTVSNSASMPSLFLTELPEKQEISSKWSCGKGRNLRRGAVIRGSLIMSLDSPRSAACTYIPTQRTSDCSRNTCTVTEIPRSRKKRAPFTELFNFCCTGKGLSYICTYICLYIYSCSYSFPLRFITGYWIYFSMLYSRTLLFIHPIYNSWHCIW